MRSVVSRVAASAAVVVVGGASFAHANVMTFQSLEIPGNVNPLIQNFDHVEDGFRLTSDWASRFGTDSNFYYGSTAIVPQSPQPGFPMTFTRSDGGAFDLLSLDLAERGNTLNCIAHLTGTFLGGGTISTTLTTDAFFATGNLASFETFNLTGFVNLSQVVFTFDSNSFLRPQIDNITAIYVPTPAAAGLLTLAGALAARRRR